MSDRLISADKAKEVLKHLLYETAMNNELDIADIYEDIIENRLDRWIELIPTADSEPVQPIEFEWCHDCKEYDQNAHCCHRWTKVIRNTINELKTQGYEPVRHGHWLKTGQSFINPNKFRNYFCSECGYELDEHIRSKPNYCQNCGADMREESR